MIYKLNTTNNKKSKLKKIADHSKQGSMGMNCCGLRYSVIKCWFWRIPVDSPSIYILDPSSLNAYFYQSISNLIILGLSPNIVRTVLLSTTYNIFPYVYRLWLWERVDGLFDIFLAIFFFLPISYLLSYFYSRCYRLWSLETQSFSALVNSGSW